MIKYFNHVKVEDGKTFADYTLFFPSVSVGNVGQLALDVLLSNVGSPEPQKIGRIFHPGIEAVVGTDPCESNGDSSRMVTSCEVFSIPEKKYVIVHFHSPVTMKRRAEFVTFFCDWIKRQNFKQVVCFSSIFAADRNDQQLAGVPFRFIATSKCDAQLVTELEKLEWEKLERRQFPAPAVIDECARGGGDDGILYLPGGGITLRMFEECQDKDIPFLSLIMFASEGDNTPEALTMFEAANKLFSFTVADTLQNISIPLTWGHFHGRPHPVEMF